MDKQTYLNFTAALGEEYCEIIAPLCEHGAEPHDGYEVFGKVFGYNDITPEKLHAAQVSKVELKRICDMARKWHETQQINEEHVREVLRRILWRWPPSSV